MYHREDADEAPDPNQLEVCEQYEYNVDGLRIMQQAWRIFAWSPVEFLVVGFFALFFSSLIASLKPAMDSTFDLSSSWSIDTSRSQWIRVNPAVDVTQQTLAATDFSFVLLTFAVDFLSGLVSWLCLVGATAACLEYMRGRRNIGFFETYCSGFHKHAIAGIKFYTTRYFLIRIGLLLFILPGLYFLLITFYFLPLCVDRPRLSVSHALSLSRHMIHKNICGHLLLPLWMLLCCFLGLFACLFGIFPALMVVCLMPATAYRDIWGIDLSFDQRVAYVSPQPGPQPSPYPSLLWPGSVQPPFSLPLHQPQSPPHLHHAPLVYPPSFPYVPPAQAFVSPAHPHPPTDSYPSSHSYPSPHSYLNQPAQSYPATHPYTPLSSSQNPNSAQSYVPASPYTPPPPQAPWPSHTWNDSAASLTPSTLPTPLSSTSTPSATSVSSTSASTTTTSSSYLDASPSAPPAYFQLGLENELKPLTRRG
eukprot:TRINITY_DN7551_c0_g1_i2.p1 TRINITY_DN7551_c0_g1~~TRINITY_DN7551_c0_g1_i2.p1  ORF type:complete len:476 (-),score=83.31 TRINITY_DN7551_c0_g1_i2:156-1583(-)